MSNVIRVEGVSREFRVKNGTLKALSDISFDVADGQTVGVVGESGCGKSTLARLIAGLDTPTSGHITVGGLDRAVATTKERQRLARLCQMVFQDPFSSLNPRMRVGDIVAEPLVIHGSMTRGQRLRETERLLDRVGLGSDALRRYPHMFSGGQRQRIGIARALALNPRILVADEPVSALDVSVQAQILNLLADLRDELGLTLLIVSHDLSVIEWIADEVVVMYLGRVVEQGACRRVFENPAHPYTRALLAASPSWGASLMNDDLPLLGSVPSAINQPTGCSFHPRCVLCQSRCKIETPILTPLESGGRAACFDACEGIG